MANRLYGIGVLLLLIGCSESLSSKDTRIVGGEEVSTFFLPYQVSLRRRANTGSAYAHTCGGTLVDGRTIVTAAHCVNGRAEQDFLVVAGTELRNGMDGGLVARVDKIVRHELYNASITDNDIALMFVSPSFPIDNHLKISPIELAKELPPAGSVTTVSGWGAVSEGGLGSSRLQQVKVPLVDNESCQSAYNWRPITDGMLCAGVPTGGKDACQGDSGGPLVIDNQLLGVVSWGEGCARAEYPGVYAAVPHFQNWIAETRAANTA